MQSWIQKLKRKFPVDQFLPVLSYSQEGEDMVLKGFFEGKKYKGFYIDVGAHHPFRFSNTAYFYKKGWRGINIEANPDAMKIFSRFRKRDVNLNIGVSGTRKKMLFYRFNEPALNGFSKEVSESRDRKNNYRITDTLDVQTYPLREVLPQYVDPNQVIDFMTIDAEGLDFEILQSNDWQKYRPEYVLVEGQVDLAQLNESQLYIYLTAQGYEWIAKTKRTLFLRPYLRRN